MQANTLVISYGFKMVSFVLILVVTWIVAKVMQKSLMAIEETTDIPKEISTLANKAIKNTIYIIGLITALHHCNARIDTILTSLGVGGIAIGFALKNTLSNMISGFLIIAYRPFGVGDYICLQTSSNGTFEGKVIAINFRYTTIEVDQNKTLVPNSVIVSMPIIIKK